jgi:Thioredoxin domain-containing protein
MKKIIRFLLFCFLVTASATAQNNSDVHILDLNTKSFKQKVWNFDADKSFLRIGKLPIILDFHATWCRPCKMLAPHLQAIQNKYKDKLIVYRIDVDQEPEIAQLFKVNAMPTIVFIGDKTKYKTELGYREYDELESLVKAYLFGQKH